MTRSYAHIGVMGSGAWGTAMAQTAARAGRQVTLWCRRKEQAVHITSRQENAERLPGVALDPGIRATWEMGALAECDAILCAAPAQHTRAILTRAAPLIDDESPIVLCAKGLERETSKLMTEVLEETIPHATPAVLSGPGFAKEVAIGLPTAVTLACRDADAGAALAAAIGHDTYRPYLSDDLIGAAVGGAIKNVLAIACGIVRGRRLGDGAHAALITRGLAEMTRFGVALGAKAETLQGLCGLGDLVLTCSNMTSRNMSLGFSLGQDMRLQDILAERHAVTEGVATAPAVMAMAVARGVEMPICAAVDAVLAGRTSIDDAMRGLLTRPLKMERLA